MLPISRSVSSGRSANWPRAVIFDLDGTLVDSAPDIQEAIHTAFRPLGVEPFSLETVKGLIGGGAAAAVKRATVKLGLVLTPDEEAAVLKRFFIDYARVSAKGRGLYPGAHDLLDALRGKEIGLALCTNKAETITLITIEALGIAGYFGAVVAARDDLPKKPDPAMLLRALAPFDVAPADAIMIGDSHADIDAARAAGLRSIAVSYGYSATPAGALGANMVVDRLADVPAALAAIEASARL